MSRLSTLRTEFDRVRSSIESVESLATSENRELSDAEQQDVDRLFERAATLRPEIETETNRQESLTQVASILARTSTTPIHRAASTTEAPELSVGEFLSSALQAQAGLITPDEHFDRCARYFDPHDRAQQKIADNPGIVPVQVVGTLMSMYDSTRPVFSSMTSRTMPDKGKTFIRPTISQHVAVGVQAAEFDPLVSQKMTITGENVTKSTIGGYLDLSQQDIDWTDPSALDLVIADFAQVYARFTEDKAIAFLTSSVSASAGYLGTTVADLAKSYVDAAVDVYNASMGMWPDTIWIDVASYATLALTLNTTSEVSGLTLVQNALNQVGAGSFKWVVGRFPANTRIIGNSGFIESYEQTKGLLRIAQPDVLGQRIAYYGYQAFYAKPAAFTNVA